MSSYGKPLQVVETPIPGLTLWELPVHGDNRGWFKENWQRQKMVSLGLPDVRFVQNNISFNDSVGTTRGVHAEPWDKFVSVATGRVFGAWVDLRAGSGFGTVFTAELDPSRAIFVPRGVGNAYQTMEPDTAYVYLVNDHWSADASYTFLNLADESAAVEWPIPLERAEVSAKDLVHPRLRDVIPVAARKTLVLGAGGQVGRALRELCGDSVRFEFADRADIDITSTALGSARRWRDYDTVINAAAYTATDAAETPDGRRNAWEANAAGVAALARLAIEHDLTLLNFSSDYVFDGTSETPYAEGDPHAPLGVYGQTKSSGDRIISIVPRHYTVRTSWVIGAGRNFVRTMADLARRGVGPSVVNDQYGRLTFASELASAALHLIDAGAPYGTYNVTGSGRVTTWADIACAVFALVGCDPGRITGVTTDQYHAKSGVAVAPRPRNSVLDLSKISAAGFSPRDAEVALAEYVGELPTDSGASA